MQQEGGTTQEQVKSIWAVDAAWNLGSHWAVYVQFLVNGFQIDSIDRALHPDQLGWLGWSLMATCQCYENGRSDQIFPDPPCFGDRLEYDHFDKWTYIHLVLPICSRAGSAPMVHPQGQDTEALTDHRECFVATVFSLTFADRES